MGLIAHFSIPFRGLKSGTHQFDFQIDSQFFKLFDNSPIEEGKFEVRLFLDRQPDMMVLVFDIDGWMAAACDRCLENIQLPIKDEQRLILKFADEQSQDPLVEHISTDAPNINVAKYIFEFICLSMPLTKIYDCESEEEPPCNEEMLKYMESEREEATKEEKTTNPIWEELKNFNKKK